LIHINLMKLQLIRRIIYFFSIGLLIIGLPFSRAMISIGTVAMLIGWLLDPKVIEKFKVFLHSKAALAFSSIFLMHIIGLLYTSDFDYALLDIRTKVPLLLFPMIMISSPALSTSELRNFLLLIAATAPAAISYSLFLFLSQDLTDFRQAFPFISHIRLSLEVLIAISIMMFYGHSKYAGVPKWIKVILLILPIYLIWAMSVLELMTGIVIFGVGVLLFMARYILDNKNKKAPWVGLIAGGGVVIIIVIYLVNTISAYNNAPNYSLDRHSADAVDLKTTQGNDYEHIPELYQIENGNYIGLYICRKELRQEWNKRSKLDYDGKDLKNQELSMTLIRYLNSLGLRKDAEGVAQLSDADIANIEKGIGNVEFSKKYSLKKRIYKLIWEYNLYKSGDIAYGHSLVQRITLWKTSFLLISENPIFGVGTGDIKKAFENKFIETNSVLKGSGLRSHNQYLSITVALGFVGLLVFLFSFIYPATVLKMWSFSPYFYLFVIMSMSMLWEDTIESQVGLTTYAFFSSIYLFARKKIG